MLLRELRSLDHEEGEIARPGDVHHELGLSNAGWPRYEEGKGAAWVSHPQDVALYLIADPLDRVVLSEDLERGSLHEGLYRLDTEAHLLAIRKVEDRGEGRDDILLRYLFVGMEAGMRRGAIQQLQS